jgi:hypothetical protein
MDWGGRFLRAIGIARGAYFLWFTLGTSAVVTGVVTAVLSVASGWPTPLVVLIGIGVLLISLGIINALVMTISSRLVPRSEPYHALTQVIEDGRRWRERLSRLDSDPVGEELAAWKVRLKDWHEDADNTVQRVAPLRLSAYLVDNIIADSPGHKRGRPEQVAQWELDLESTLERLLYLRITL